MIRLSDLVHRSSLRNRTAGDVEVSSFSPKVFEVTNLLIPSGTDWSDQKHVIGTFEAAATQAVAYSLFIQLDRAIGFDGDGIELFPQGLGPVATVDTYAGIAHLSTGVVTADVGFSSPLDAPASPKTVPVVIDTYGPTTKDFVVQYARAAFLVI